MEKFTENFEKHTQEILSKTTSREGRYVKVVTDNGHFTGILQTPKEDKIEVSVIATIDIDSIKEIIHYKNTNEIPDNERRQEIDLIINVNSK